MNHGINPDNIPGELKRISQWVCWRWATKTNGEKTKVPVSPVRPGNASSTDPSTWGGFTEAMAMVERGLADGVGFVFTKRMGYIGVDLDDCYTHEHGARSPECGWVEKLNSYTEVSPSGKGLKVIFKGVLPEGLTRHSWGGNGIYDSGRFFTITGNTLAMLDHITEVRPETLQPLLDAWFPEKQAAVEYDEAPERFTDNEVWKLVTASANGLYVRDLAMGLWKKHYESQSEADLALIQSLAFYTGPCPTQLDRLFRDTRLMRDKWDELRGGETYGERTIRMALETRDEYFDTANQLFKKGNTIEFRQAPQPQVQTPRWKQQLVGYEGLKKRERPYALGLLHEHLQPLGYRLGEDWLDVSALCFFSALFPQARFENLPLNLWVLGISDQGVGKSIVSDELDKLTHGMAFANGDSLLRYTSGSSAGLIRRLQGTYQQVLAYFSEWTAFAKSMGTEHSGDMREVLMNLYDGRSVVHQLAQESVIVNDPYLVINGLTTPRNFVNTGDASDASNGFYSRLMFLCPDPIAGTKFQHRNQQEREEVVGKLAEHVKSLPDFRAIIFDTPRGDEPPAYVEYASYLGVVEDGRTINLDDVVKNKRAEMPYGRLLARVKKVASLLELMEDVPQIQRGVCFVREENVSRAVRITQRCNAYATRALSWLSSNKDEADIEAVKAALESGDMTLRDTMKASGLGYATTEKALSILMDEGSVRQTLLNGVRVYQLAGEYPA